MLRCLITTCALSAIAAFLAASATANDLYIATNGNDANDGSFANPLATFEAAIALSNPGDTIFARGGTYNLATRIRIRNTDSGADGSPVNLWAYPGETPILDFAAMPSTLLGASSGRGIQFDAGANWWNVKGLVIQNAKDNGLYNGGSNNVFERLVVRFNADSGFQLHDTAANNRVLNTDSYENYDPQNRGENADGFAVKSPTIGAGNIFRGNRAWKNSDDGWDMFDAFAHGVLIQDSWAYDNGFDPENDPSTFDGDGNGLKLGRDSGSHVLHNVLAWGNPHNGIDVNANGTDYVDDVPVGPNGSLVQVYNSTSYNNGEANWRFDEEVAHVLRNNVSLSGGASDVFAAGIDDALNSWNGVGANASDFVSLVETIARGPRNPDGSLPVSDFLHLAVGSDLIDAGTPISFFFDGVTYNLSYSGAAPDLGAYETVPAVPMPDVNMDGVVDIFDVNLVSENWGASGPPGIVGDANKDGVIDIFDVNLISTNWTPAPASAGGAVATAPEPPALTLLGLGCVMGAMAARRGNRRAALMHVAVRFVLSAKMGRRI